MCIVNVNNMAGHIVVEFPISDAKTVFTGTSEEDSAYLKIFWKSIHLNPTIESRLVSSDVRQRIPPHPMKSHGPSSASTTTSGSEKQKFKFREEDPPKLTDFSRSVFRLESEDLYRKRMSHLEKRDYDINKRQQRKERREMIQRESSQRVVSAEPLQVLPPITAEYNDDLDPDVEDLKDAMQAFSDIDSFEKELAHKVQGKEPVNEEALVLD